MMISKDNPEQLIHSNDGIQADIWDALRKEDTIRPLDLGSLSIKVRNGDVYLNGYLKEENQPLVESTIHSVVGVVEVHNHLRTNDGILAAIWDALWREAIIRSLDLDSLSIDVKDGEVYLKGYLATENDLPLIDSIAHSITGVVAVHNYLVTDRELIIQVAESLARDECTRPYILPVRVFHGWVHIGGEVPTRDLQHIAEKVAGEISSVRGVISLPKVTGENPNMPQRTMQPRVGATVYGKIDEVGVVTQVVIQPENRLVTHVVVRSKELRDGNLVTCENIVPVKDTGLVNDENILLERNGQPLIAYPVLDPDEYPLAPFTWKAPYPYTAGEVRWSIKQLYEIPYAPPKTNLEPYGSGLLAVGVEMSSVME